MVYKVHFSPINALQFHFLVFLVLTKHHLHFILSIYTISSLISNFRSSFNLTPTHSFLLRYTISFFLLLKNLIYFPTCVGYTNANWNIGCGHSIHPHLRGAYGFCRSIFSRNCGSSPPAWGIRRVSMILKLLLRFIPTCVGHTPRLLMPAQTFPAHPHLRGAYVSSLVSQLLWHGSSPPAWGIRWVFLLPCSSSTVHPHLRGAYIGCPIGITSAIGSSPPAWGIPCKSRLRRCRNAVHPHLRGAYTIGWCGRRRVDGSSPPAWGIRYRPVLPCCLRPVHPHLRGAYVVLAIQYRKFFFGSSPPAWGIRGRSSA
mgnify:CR=1 FL=1